MLKKQEKENVMAAYAAVIEHLRSEKQTEANMSTHEDMKRRLRALREG